MIRVCQNNGYIVFDIFSDINFDHTCITLWLKGKDRYPVILPEATVVSFFKKMHCAFTGKFLAKTGLSFSTYLVFRKKSELS
jgi:hypothetical protein